MVKEVHKSDVKLTLPGVKANMFINLHFFLLNILTQSALQVFLVTKCTAGHRYCKIALILFHSTKEKGKLCITTQAVIDSLNFLEQILGVEVTKEPLPYDINNCPTSLVSLLIQFSK